MAYSAYLNIPGIPGDATDAGHRDWIEVTSFAMGVTSARDVSTGQSGRKRQYDPVKISTPVGRATGALYEVVAKNKRFPRLDFEFIRTAATGKNEVYYRLTLEDAVVVSLKSVTATVSDGSPRRDFTEYCMIEFAYDRQKGENVAPNPKPDTWGQANVAQPGDAAALAAAVAPGQAPDTRSAVHAVARAIATAPAERSTLNLRPPKFFELALPLLTGENGKRIYPPADGTLRLVSRNGYNRSYAIPQGMITDDQYCSFRFYDVSEKAVDELFTATLESGGVSETIFRDRRVATYIQAARQNGKYETTFAPAQPATQPTSPRDELLPPVDSA